MPLRLLPEVPDGSVSCGADPAQCAGVKVHLSRNLSISGVVSSQRGEGTEDHRVLVGPRGPMATGNHVSLRSLCSLLYPV